MSNDLDLILRIVPEVIGPPHGAVIKAVAYSSRSRIVLAEDLTMEQYHELENAIFKAIPQTTMCNCPNEPCRWNPVHPTDAVNERLDELERRVNWWEKYPSSVGELTNRIKRLESEVKNDVTPNTKTFFEEALQHLRGGYCVRRYFWPSGQFLSIKDGEMLFFSYGKGTPLQISSSDIMASDWRVIPKQEDL